MKHKYQFKIHYLILLFSFFSFLLLPFDNVCAHMLARVDGHMVITAVQI